MLEDKLLIRIGIRWKADVELSNIKSVERFVSDEKEYTEMTVLNEKNIFITLHKPIMAQGIFGIMKKTSKIALYLDEPHLFMEKVS